MSCTIYGRIKTVPDVSETMMYLLLLSNCVGQCPMFQIRLLGTSLTKADLWLKCRILPFFTFLWPCILTNFFVIKPTRCTNFIIFLSQNPTCFGEFVCPSSGVYSLYIQQWYMSYRFADSFRAGPGWNSILFLLESCLQTCMTCTIAECTVNKLLMMDRRTVRNM